MYLILAKYIDHWLADVAPNKLAKTTYSRDQQDVRRILPAAYAAQKVQLDRR